MRDEGGSPGSQGVTVAFVPDARGCSSLDDVRRLYGRSMRPLTSGGSFSEGDGWWIGVTGAPDPDYNLALVYGGDVHANTRHVFDGLTDAGFPSILLLAGPGLGAAQVLADRGWVCAGALDLTYLTARDESVDSGFRPLRAADMAHAREVATGAFGIASGTADIAYSDVMPGAADVEVVGLFDDELLQCCTLFVDSGPLRTVWSLGTRREGQRRGYARRLITSGAAHTYAQRGAVPLCGLTNPQVTPLYLAAGAEVAESWQMWSRPRWILGA